MTTIRIATYNLENLGPPFVDPDSLPNPESRDAAWLAHERHIESARRMLGRLRADVVALQEVLDEKTLRETLAGTVYESYEATPLDPAPDVERHQVILSRFPIKQFRLHRQESRVFWVHHGDADPSPVEWSRPIVEANVALPGIGPTRFFAVHLKSKRPSEVHRVVKTSHGGWPSLAAHSEGEVLSSLKRVGQALEVRRLVDALHERYDDARAVVLGDCNDTVDSVPVSIIRGSYVGAKNPALWDKELYPVELSVPEEKQYTLIHDGKPQMIDHILISRSLLGHFQTATVLNETVRDHASAHPPHLFFPDSDHAPVVMELWAGHCMEPSASSSTSKPA